MGLRPVQVPSKALVEAIGKLKGTKSIKNTIAHEASLARALSVDLKATAQEVLPAKGPTMTANSLRQLGACS